MLVGAAQGLAERRQPVAVGRHPRRGRLRQAVEVVDRLVPDRRRDRARLDQDHVDALGVELLAPDVSDRFDGELRRVVGARERRREHAADRADEDDPPAGPAHERQHGLRGGDLADHVDLELAAQVVERQQLQRRREADARVVDQAIQSAAGEPARDARRRPRRSRGPSDIEDDDVQALRRAGERGGVGGGLDAGEHLMTVGGEPQRGRGADSAGGSGDQEAGHARGTPAGRVPIS